MLNRRSLAAAFVNVTLFVTISATFLFGVIGLFVNALTQPDSPFERVISTTSGVVAVAVAIALTGLALKRRGIQLLGGSIVTLAALHSLIVNLSMASIFYLDFLESIDAYFYPPVAFTFVTLGLTLMLNPRERIQRRWMQVFASILIVLAVASFVLHFTPNGFALLGPHPPVTSLATITLFLIGISLVLASNKRKLHFNMRLTPATSTTFALVATICTTWFVLSLNQINATRTEAESIIAKVATVRQQTIQVNIQVLNRLRERWQQLDVPPTSEFARFDTATYLRDIPHYLGIHLIDNRGRTVWQQHRNDDTSYLESLNYTSIQQWLSSAPPDISMLIPAEHFRGDRSPLGFLMMPVGYQADVRFYLLVTFDLMQLISPDTRLMPESLKIYASLDEDRVISLDQDKPTQRSELTVANAELIIPYGQPLKLSVSLYTFEELESASNLRMIVALLGLLSCIAFLALTQQNELLSSHSLRLRQAKSRLYLQTRRLKLSEQQFRSLFAFHPDAVFALDKEGMVVQANESVHQISGASREQIIGAHFSVFIVPHERALAEAFFQRALRGEVCRYELNVLTTNGEQKQINVTNLPVKIGDEITGVFGIAKDVTAQNEQDKQLRILERGINSSTNGIIISGAQDPSSPIIYANDAFLEMTGYEHHEIVGKSCDFLIGPKTNAENIDKVRTALRDKTDCNVQVLHYRKNGEWFWDELQLAPVADAHGTITHFIGIHEDVTERVESEQLMAFQAQHDDLTNLLNRSTFEQRLSDVIRTHGLNEKHSQWATYFIDLDGFKPINEAMGLSAGDEVLKQVALRLHKFTQHNGFTARFGGDEFVLAVQGQNLSALDAIGHELLEIIAEPYTVHQQRVYLTASIGVACYCSASQQAVDLIQQADNAMTMAKRQGRNHLYLYKSELAQNIRLDVNLRNQFQQAIDEGKLQLFYQPIVDLKSGKIVSVEALMRWQLDSGQWIAPDRFIPMAEATGQIIPASEWALDQACQDLVKLREQQPDLAMSVNLSAVQFSRAQFLTSTLATVQRYQLPPETLELEITESVLMEDSKQAIKVMQKLRDAGLPIALDDFGTGFSSLSYLKTLPIDYLKIDRAFIQDIDNGAGDEAIVRGILAMARQFDIEVVAEGVETAEQAVKLQKLGCDYGQGYYFAKPMPLAELLSLMT